ncbi:ankyrin repeat domain-containing protein [Flagellimonas sp. HMM57]|uniref:ankyrin repeat domain-containing protein n=1 Tax=unclassified Flagellimonas TaxID=2644544 RepID=UPI0013D31EDE|nr:MULTISPECIES: ankyrin repeat domain-containing protein [unclassified Flagellimonas]UII77320.1 ankyrin repeat domain-containing protein [Flagellimonas sp. HMM57]
MKQITITIITLLLSWNGIKAQYSSSIHDASRNGETETVKALIAKNPDILNQKNPMGFTPLILAVYNDQEETAKVLIDEGADIDAFDKSGNTALMGAIFKGFLNQVELLVASGANVNQQNYNHATALTFAATFGTAELAKILMEAGGDPNLKDNQGKTPLDHALFQGNGEVVRIFKKQ